MSMRLAFQRSLEDQKGRTPSSQGNNGIESLEFDQSETGTQQRKRSAPKRKPKPVATAERPRRTRGQTSIAQQHVQPVLEEANLPSTKKRKQSQRDGAEETSNHHKRTRTNGPLPSAERPTTPPPKPFAESSASQSAGNRGINRSLQLDSSSPSSVASSDTLQATPDSAATFGREDVTESGQVNSEAQNGMRGGTPAPTALTYPEATEGAPEGGISEPESCLGYDVAAGSVQSFLPRRSNSSPLSSSPSSVVDTPDNISPFRLKGEALAVCGQDPTGPQDPSSKVSTAQGVLLQVGTPEQDSTVQDFSRNDTVMLYTSSHIAVEEPEHSFDGLMAGAKEYAENPSPRGLYPVAGTGKSEYLTSTAPYIRPDMETVAKQPTPTLPTHSNITVEQRSPRTRTSGRTITATKKFEGPVETHPGMEQLEVVPRLDVVQDHDAGNDEFTPNKHGSPVSPKGKTSRTQRAATRAKATSKQAPAGEFKVSKPKKTQPKKLQAKKPPAKEPQPEHKPESDDEDQVIHVSTKKTPIKTAHRNPAESLPTPPNSISAADSDKGYGTMRQPIEPSSPSCIVKLPAKKLALSQKLTKRSPLESKPDPQGPPEVWAESRQALCETLSYFKKPQGGCYQNEGHIYGFLFDSVGHCREYVDENLIICRAGGSMESDPSGGMVQKKDQSLKEAQVQAVLNDIAHRNPVVVICGNRNIGAPCKMPHQYCVLGWYKPICVWTERTAGKGRKVWTTVKYRLERLNRHKPTWHAPEDSCVSDEERSSVGPLLTSTCGACQTDYPQVYLQSWMCLNADCAEFWKIRGEDAPFGKDGLDYNPAFLLHESGLWKGDGEDDEPEPTELRPPVPAVGLVIGDNLAYVNTRGICCPNCGRCNSRRLFKGWVCENCNFKLFPQHRPVIPAMLHTPWDAAPTLIRNKHAPGVKLTVEHKYGYKISTYIFDNVNGCFIHAAASKGIVQEKDGPDDMFAAIQTEDMGLERRTFASKRKSSITADRVIGNRTQDTASNVLTPAEDTNAEADTDDMSAKEYEFEDGDLMTAFSMNYGMPYKFVASGASKPFEDGPWPVRACRRRLNWAQQTILDQREDDQDFNEELIFAYLEGQKIEYHDDGEQGLGPRIATLSLGGRAKMHMRVKQKHFVGHSKTGIFTEERPVPGNFGGNEMYQKRLEKWNELQKLKDDGPSYTKRRKEIPKELGLIDKTVKNKKASDLVTVTLNHGDIIIMDGYDIQKYLEHKVVPEGYLRFALTCRTVLKNHLKPDERPDYGVEVDPEEYKGPAV